MIGAERIERLEAIICQVISVIEDLSSDGVIHAADLKELREIRSELYQDSEDS